jgi:hypothetical protein
MSKRLDYIKQLKAEGWHKLGGGHFSEAFGKGGRVIKVSYREDQGKGPSNDAYVAFASWVVLHGRDNPFLPRIYGMEIIHDEDEDGDDTSFYTVELERLTSLYDVDDGSVIEAFHAARAAFEGRGRDEDEDVSEPDTMERDCDCDQCVAKVREWERQNGEAEAETEPSTSRIAAAEEAGRILREAFHSVASFDLHDQNAMVRENEDGSFQLVITDPIAWVHDHSAQEEWMTEALRSLNPQYSLPF